MNVQPLNPTSVELQLHGTNANLMSIDIRSRNGVLLQNTFNATKVQISGLEANANYTVQITECAECNTSCPSIVCTSTTLEDVFITECERKWLFYHNYKYTSICKTPINELDFQTLDHQHWMCPRTLPIMDDSPWLPIGRYSNACINDFVASSCRWKLKLNMNVGQWTLCKTIRAAIH